MEDIEKLAAKYPQLSEQPLLPALSTSGMVQARQTGKEAEEPAVRWNKWLLRSVKLARHNWLLVSVVN